MQDPLYSAVKRPPFERLWRADLRWHEIPPWAALVPAAGIYRLALNARAAFWRRMRRRARPFVISVGNLTVGGNAKTPFTIFLASRLAAHDLKVGIVSRGYARSSNAARAILVSDGQQVLASPEEAGDEASMTARSFEGPVAVARRRIHGIELIEERTGPVDVVVLDDAFQHLRLARDIDLLLVNADRGFGNGWLLPAGPMREPRRAAARADAVILIGPTGAASQDVDAGWLADHRCVLRASVRARGLVRPGGLRWIEGPLALHGRRVVAVSGLADARGFYRMLRELEADLVGVLEYPDHHVYTTTDWHTIVAAARDRADIITTEKDLVKLQRFPFERDSLYALRLEVAMDADHERLLEMIADRWNARMASASGGLKEGTREDGA